MEKQDSKRLRLSTALEDRGVSALVVDEEQTEIATTPGGQSASPGDADVSPEDALSGSALSGGAGVQPASDAGKMPAPGSFKHLGLPERYQVIELLGEGGMAHVYKAFDSEGISDVEHRPVVAIKILRPEIAPDPSIVERFFREAKAAQKLSHKNLVSVFGYGTTGDNMPYLIMEYVEGHNLAQIISEDKHLSGDRGIKIFVQIAEGLRDAHKLGMVHRDLKPSNILIATNDDGTDSVKIADFGIAKPASSERSINPDLTRTGAILGSPAYMSPEQCLGHVVDERSDIYSLGCLMYETLTGRSPFWSDTPVKSLIRHLEEQPEPFEIEFKQLGIPKGLEAIVMQCLEKEPAKRFQRIEQLIDALTAPVDPGVRRRFWAEFTDVVLVLFLMPVVGCLTGWLLKLIGIHNSLLSGDFDMILLISAYYFFYESSGLQATPGKLLTGLKVISTDGRKLNRLSTLFSGATTANIVMTIAYLAMFAGIFCFRVHNHWSKVINLGFGMFMLTAFFVFYSTLMNNGRRSLFDYLFDRQVARPVSAIRPADGKHLLKHGLICLLSFVLPVFFVFFGDFYRAQQNNPLLRKVVCVKYGSHLKPGDVITKDMVDVLVAPDFLVPEGTAHSTSEVIGKSSLSDLPTYEAIKDSDLAPPPSK